MQINATVNLRLHKIQIIPNNLLKIRTTFEEILPPFGRGFYKNRKCAKPHSFSRHILVGNKRTQDLPTFVSAGTVPVQRS